MDARRASPLPARARAPRTLRLAVLGALAAVFIVAQAVYHLAHGEAHELFWSCNVGCLLLAIGCALRSARLVAVATLWLCLGTPLWVLDVATGGTCGWPSWFSHLGGLAIGVVAACELGVPRGSTWLALAGLALLVLVSHFATPAAANVNLSHAVWDGWEDTFTSYPLYLVFLGAVSTATFLACQLALTLLSRLVTRRAASQPVPAAATEA